jgi:hypothetical protein
MLIAFPRTQSLRKRVSTLRYMYIAFLVIVKVQIGVRLIIDLCVSNAFNSETK